VNAVLLSVLAVLLGGQVPLPGAPDLPMPPAPAQHESIKSSPLMPASPGHPEVLVPPGRSESGKPPPFKLIDANPPPETMSLKPAPMPLAEPASSSGSLAPCLLLMRSGPASVRAGEPFCYEIIARNPGNVTAAQVKLEEELPPGTKFLSAQPIAVAEGDRLIWSVENLGPGAERRFKVEVEAGQGGEWKATATLSVSASNTMTTSVAGAVQQALTMTGPGSLPVGHPVVFQMRICNTTAAPMTDLLLRVQMASGLQHLQGDAIEASLGDLAPGQTKELSLDAITVQTGRLAADATLFSGKRTIATAESAVVATEQPTLALRQTGPLSPPVGGEHEFKLEVINRSASDLQNVEVTDSLPEGLQFAAGDARAQYDQKARTIRWQVGTLAPGQSRLMVFRAQVRGAGPQINRISARATGVSEAQLQAILRLGGGR
jgi:uncharacterized repeat protein (TIGR01451 family)